jgi:hypothetical protein
LPKYLVVYGDLDAGCTPISSIPETIIVHGAISIENTEIQEIPNWMTDRFKGISMRGCKVTELPGRFKVDGNLDISDTNITELPKDLIISGDLNLCDCKVKRLPERLLADGCVTIGYGQTMELPQRLTIPGSLDIYRSVITELPKQLIVGKDLIVNKTQYETLSPKTKVGGNIFIKQDREEGKCVYTAKKLQDGDYERGRYIFADGVLTILDKYPSNVKHRTITNSQGKETKCTVFLGKGGERNVVTDGEHYVVCEKIIEGLESIATYM